MVTVTILVLYMVTVTICVNMATVTIRVLYMVTEWLCCYHGKVTISFETSYPGLSPVLKSNFAGYNYFVYSYVYIVL